MPGRDSTINGLPIEISGWDAEAQFFVEKSDLDWSESGRKTVFLRHRLRSGSIVFVRLLAASGLGKNYPTPHQAETVEPSDRVGFSKVQLVESRPRRSIFRAPDGPLEHLMKCRDEG